jgi:hypothetical protein
MLEKRKRTRLEISQDTYAALKNIANVRRMSMANALLDAVLKVTLAYDEIWIICTLTRIEQLKYTWH